MSRAIQCDRCGAYYPHPGWDGRRVNVMTPEWRHDGRGFDLCDDCMRTLLRWLNVEDGLSSDKPEEVDRDALIKIADRMDEMAGQGAMFTESGLVKVARKIRDALGVTDDD